MTALHDESATCRCHTRTLPRRWWRPLQIEARSSGCRSRARNVDAHCGGPPLEPTCAPSVCRCPGLVIGAESVSTERSPEHADMRHQPTHGAHLRQGMASGKAVRVEAFETPARPALPRATAGSATASPPYIIHRFLVFFYTVVVSPTIID